MKRPSTPCLAQPEPPSLTQIDLEVGALALQTEYRLGNTIIRVYDDACATSQADVDAILKRLSSLVGVVTREAGTEPEEAIAQ